MDERQNLSALADILFMPVLFYVMTQWGQVYSWQGMVLWFVLLMIIYNEMMSVRESYSVYSISIYTLDLFSLFVYVVAVNALTKKDPYIGYSPTYWIAIGSLWIFYGVWDFIMINNVGENDKSDYRKWGYQMILSALITFVCYWIIVQTRGHFDTKFKWYLCQIAQVCALGLICRAICLWIRDRHKWFKGLRARP